MKKSIFIFISIFIIFMSNLYAEGGSNNPEVTIVPNYQEITEGNIGTKTLYFQVTIDKCPDISAIKIKYSTSNGSARVNSDYSYSGGSITFNVGNCQKSYNISVTIKGETDVEQDETFYLNLSNDNTFPIQNFHFGNSQATIKILNDDSNKYADLSIAKTNNSGGKKLNVGDYVTYTLVGQNNGPNPTKISMWDTFPSDLEFISVSDDSYDFDCQYYSGSRKVRCNGNRVFNPYESVRVTIQAKIKSNSHYSVTNHSGIKPKGGVSDNNNNNNRSQSKVYLNRADIKVYKRVINKNGKEVNEANFDINDEIVYKVKFGNYKEHPTQIYFVDQIPQGLNLLYVDKQNIPNDFNCNIDSSNKIECYGTHQFYNGEEVTLYIHTKATANDKYFNGAWAGSANNIYESSNYNNWDGAIANVGIEENEGIKDTAKVIFEPIKSEYYVGDIVTFKIYGTNKGLTRKVKIKDWLNKESSTNGAFEFVSVESDNSFGVNMICSNQGNGYDFFVDCISQNEVSNNQQFGIKLKVKLKKVGNVCNTAHFYKYYHASWGDWEGWVNYAKKCFNVSQPKAKPHLKPKHLLFYLNVYKSVDLKNFTTDDDTPKNQLTYQLVTPLPNGLHLSSNGVISGTYTDSSGRFPKDFNTTIKVTDSDGLSDSATYLITIKAANIKANDNYYKIPITTTLNGNLITDSSSSGAHKFNADIGQGLKLISVTPTLTYSSDGSFSYVAPKNPGTYKFTYTIEDKYGQTDSAKLTIEVYKPKIKANDDIFKVAKNTPYHGNVFSDNSKGVDVGDDIKVISYTNPSHGLLHIGSDGKLVYTPNIDFAGMDKATYTIKDKYGQKDSATIYFDVGTIYQDSYQEFYLVNPPISRNLVGNYITIGNSVTCITNSKDKFNGTCQQNQSLSNNDYMVKYIDVDNDSNTWNSSSATFTIPNNYLNLNNGKGIVWAGLFWQGSVNNRFSGFLQRRASYNGYKTINKSEPINIQQSGADKILIKVDNSPNYTTISSDTFYNDLAHGDFGGYYAAYANITSFLQKAKLTKGKHKITIANIVTNEGREPNVGNYGGWSLVIIYKEDLTGKPRNISIYNGFQPLGKGGNTNIPSKEIKISGFKLPKNGVVESKISAFVGEGEQKYGGSNIVYDKMYIRDTNKNSIYDMPSSNPNNIFNATIENITREPGKFNDIKNTNGIDVDSYDVSSIMQQIRDNKVDTDSVNIGIISKDENKNDGDDSDYVVASMLGFATELYAPKICYDADIKLGEYINIENNDREFKATNIGKPLQTKIMIRSQEADFDLIHSKLHVEFTPDNFTYIKGKSKYSPPNEAFYYPAIETNSNIGEIAIGHNVNSNGGVISANEVTYAKLYYNFKKDSFNGKFDIFVNADVSFNGITDVPFTLSTSAPKGSIFHIKRCESNPVYNPVYGTFNIERGDSKFNMPEDERYSLNTQVVGVPYQISVASYKKDSNGNYTLPNSVDTAVELELIDASTFENNSSSGFDSVCRDPQSASSGGVFVKFNNNSRVKLNIPDDFEVNGVNRYPQTLALRNAAFRVWVLTKKSGKDNLLIKNNCNSQFDSSCFENIYNTYYKDSKYCKNECTNSRLDNCYQCLKHHFATPICSRDNFAIRPESYSIAISDNNETNAKKAAKILDNKSINYANIAAGYLYRLDINATVFNNLNAKADGYYLNVKGDEVTKKALSIFDDKASCLDKANKDLNIHMLNGISMGEESLKDNPTNPLNGLIINNSGKYKLHIEDNEWTLIDQKGYKYKPFKDRADCVKNSKAIFDGILNATRGCTISSDFGYSHYYDLKVNLHPYSFNIDPIALYTNPNRGANYLYINDLNQTKNLIQNGEEMAINISGNIKAIGKNGITLTNYTKSCSAKNLDILIKFNTLKDGNITTIKDSLNNTITSLYSLFVPSVDSTVYVNKANDNNISLNFKNIYFTDSNSSAGEAMFNLYFNYQRTYNGAINPFDINFRDFYLKSPLDASYVDLNNNHIPEALKDLNSSRIFYYAKVKSKSDFYDDIETQIIKTPILVTIYCSEDLDYCQKYGIDVNKDITNEYDWWIAKNHDATTGKEGKAILETKNNKVVTVYPAIVENFVNGIDKNVKVQDVDIVNRPYTAYIKPTSTMIANYPWLLFNKFENKVPDYIYKVRFIDAPAAWSGKGKTGHTINVDASGRKTKKVNW